MLNRILQVAPQASNRPILLPAPQHLVSVSTASLLTPGIARYDLLVAQVAVVPQLIDYPFVQRIAPVLQRVCSLGIGFANTSAALVETGGGREANGGDEE